MQLKINLSFLGYFSKRSHYTASGNPKVAYGSKATAELAAYRMAEKFQKPMDAYRCWVYCRKWHIGGS